MPQFDHVAMDDPIHRLINSRWPTIGVFDELADDESELRTLFVLEVSTNPRINASIGRLDHIPEGDIVTGDAATFVMAAFVHCHEDGGRFNDGRLGAWYASLHVETAIEETAHHLTRRLSLSEGGYPQQMQMRQLITTTQASLLDLSDAPSTRPELFLPDDYSESQKFAASVRWPFSDTGELGLLYQSVRHNGGTNVCLFKPDAVGRPLRQGDHYEYEWDANGEIYVSKLTNVKRP